MKKKNSNIFIWVFAAVALFLAVPFLFQEEQTVTKGKLSIDSEGSLPIVDSENPLAKYIDRLTSFYGLKRKKSSSVKNLLAKKNSYDSYGQYAASEENLSPELNAENKKDSAAATEELTAQDIATLRASFEKNPDAFFSANSVKTKSGMELTPDSNGYTYKDTYYKNGTYPDKKYKKEIETALNKYHTNLAQKIGLQPAYVRNSDGSLTVQYFDKETFDKEQQPILASSARFSDNGRYQNARVISKGAGYGGVLDGGMPKKVSSGTSYRHYSKQVGFDDMEDLYSSVSERIAAYNAKDNETPETRGGGETVITNNVSKDILQSSSYLPLAAGKPADRSENPNLMTADYANSAGIILENDAVHLDSFLGRYGVSGNFEGMTVIPVHISKPEQLLDESLMEDLTKKVLSQIDAIRSDNGKIKIFSTSELPPKLRAKGNNMPDTYVAFPRTPYVKFDNGKYEEVPTFSNVFLERTGISNMFTAMGVSEDQISKLKDEYGKLDLRRKKNSEYFRLMSENKQIQQKMPKIVYYLGKMPRDNSSVAVASPSSYLYAYTPNMAPDFIIKNNVSNMSIERMSPESFLYNVSSNGNNIVVVNDENVSNALKRSGVKSVVVISADNLYSGTPKAIGNVLDSLKDVIKEKILSDTSLKDDLASQIKSMGKEIAKSEQSNSGSSARI